MNNPNLKPCCEEKQTAIKFIYSSIWGSNKFRGLCNSTPCIHCRPIVLVNNILHTIYAHTACATIHHVHHSCRWLHVYNNYSMSPSWIWSDKITNEHVAWVGYNHFISNKGKWDNCFSKFSNRVLLPIFILFIIEGWGWKLCAEIF